MNNVQALIEQAFENRASLVPGQVDPALQIAVEDIITQLDAGKLRVAEKIQGQWQTHQWIKKAVLLYFRLHENHPMEAGCLRFYDKVPLKFQNWTQAEISALNYRVVPSAIVRRGAYI